MAIWHAVREASGGVVLTYINATTVEKLGDLRRDTPPSLVLEWILERDVLSCHDVIILHDGVVLQVVSPGEA